MKRYILFGMLYTIFTFSFADFIPIAVAKPDTLQHLGFELVDNWAWLKNRDNPVLGNHLKLEDRYTARNLKASQKLSKQLYKEFVGWIPKQQTSAVRAENNYLYFSKSCKNKPYPIHYRTKDSPGSKEEVVLDENKLAKGKDYFALGFFVISPDSKLLAYSTDCSGDETYTLHIKNLDNGKTQNSGISEIGDFVWQSDSRHCFITKQNERLQTDSCYRLDTATNEQTLLYKEQDSAYDIGLSLSCDNNYVILLSSSKTCTEAHYIRRSSDSEGFVVLEQRRKDHHYYPDILNEILYIQTNLWHPDFSIIICDLSHPEAANWKQLIPAKESMPIDGFAVFTDNLVLVRRINGEKSIQVASVEDGSITDEIIPDNCSDLNLWFNPNPKAGSFTYSLESELMPYGIYRYSFHNKEIVQIYHSDLAKPYSADLYSMKVVQVPSLDGTLIRLSIVFRKDLDLSKPQAVWLSGYGAYGDPNDPWFSTSRLSLLDRNIIFATAHIRGGGEFGQYWYDAGRLQNKKNTFDDFVACIDYLLDNKICTADKLIIEGGSAGGLLMGVVTNLVPEKIGLVIADVPFVDMISTMLDTELPLTQQEYEEWGNPNFPNDFAYMLSYSPYENVHRTSLPKMLISAAWFDTRVGYWEALKWTQKLRTNNLGSNPIVFRLLSSEGHTGSSNIYMGLKSIAITYAYAIKAIME